jgi:thiol-disulfide isomerase/thioredoxin
LLDQEGLNRRRALAALAGALAGAAFGVVPARAAEPVKHLLPNQYKDRIVAPRKGRVLLVNFWATWCEPCREELPALVAAARSFESKDVAVVLVSLDSEKTGLSEVPRFLAKEKVPFVCWLLKAHDPQPFIDGVDRKWDGTLPHSVVYDRKGAVVTTLPGKQTEATFMEALKKALAKA